MSYYRFKIASNYLAQEIEYQAVAPIIIERVLILLHGYWDEDIGAKSKYKDPLDEMNNNLNLQEYADKHNVLIVTPYLYNWFYINREGRDVSSFLHEELINDLDGRFDMNNFDCYLAGISMGGYGTLIIGLNHPEYFKGYGSISGAFISNDISIANPLVVGFPDSVKRRQYYMDTFGPIDTFDNDPSRNVEAAISAHNVTDTLPTIILTCGTEDMLYPRNIRILNMLATNKISYKWEVFEGEDHLYPCFDKGLGFILEGWFR